MKPKRILIIGTSVLALLAATAWAVTPGRDRESGSALRIVVDPTADTTHETGDIRILTVDDAHSVHAAALLDPEPTSRVDWTVRDGDRTTGATDTEVAKATAWADAWTLTHPDRPVPPQAQIPTPGLNGPSLGLAAALGDIDALTDGDLTGSRLVAATGVVDANGSVRAIGKVDVKARTARDVGVRILLVPDENVREARAAVANDDRGMRIVGVESVANAVRVLCESGGLASDVCPTH